MGKKKMADVRVTKVNYPTTNTKSMEDKTVTQFKNWLQNNLPKNNSPQK